eukprot:TRINITY_DN93849_c0_g1_i1.p1 TRINITY_DN93849_c0_g1~~TRINITY_DN93849_c0_g1_i1.p1  ORF type:complete len:787 (+),score=10.86 TRINITY_DN93849_c0_g1_i1:75-2363(+)
MVIKFCVLLLIIISFCEGRRICPPVSPGWRAVFDAPELSEFSELVQHHFQCEIFSENSDGPVTILAPINGGLPPSHIKRDRNLMKILLGTHIILPNTNMPQSQSSPLNSLMWSVHTSHSGVAVQGLTRASQPPYFVVPSVFSVSPSVKTSQGKTVLVTPSFFESEALVVHTVDSLFDFDPAPVLHPTQCLPDSPSLPLSKWICPKNEGRDYSFVLSCSDCDGNQETLPNSRVCGAVRKMACSPLSCDTWSLVGNVEIEVSDQLPTAANRVRCPTVGYCRIRSNGLIGQLMHVSCPLCGTCDVKCWDDLDGPANCDETTVIQCPRKGNCAVDCGDQGSCDEGVFLECPDEGDCNISTWSSLDEAAVVIGPRKGKVELLNVGTGSSTDEGFQLIGRGTSTVLLQPTTSAADEGAILVTPPRGSLTVSPCEGVGSCDEGFIVFTEGNGSSATINCLDQSCGKAHTQYCLAGDCEKTCEAAACNSEGMTVCPPLEDDGVCNVQSSGLDVLICLDTRDNCLVPPAVHGTPTYCSPSCDCQSSSCNGASLVCRPDEHCTIACGSNQCQHAQVLCPDDAACELTCDDTCRGFTAIGPAKGGHLFKTTCNTGGCNSMAIHCNTAEHCVVECNGSTCSFISVRGPNYGNLELKCIGDGSCTGGTTVTCGRGGDCDVMCVNGCKSDVVVVGATESIGDTLRVACDGPNTCSDDFLVVCPTYGDCVLTCRNGSCQQTAVYCPRKGKCDVQCDTSSCTAQMHIFCPPENPRCST